MDGRYIEPRQVMWAVAEITWEDDRGMSIRVPAILEDTSDSGACIRLKRPPAIGSKLMIKWHREQFSAVARNCRPDGGDFLLGVWRTPKPHPTAKGEAPRAPKTQPKPQAENAEPQSRRVAALPEALPAAQVSQAVESLLPSPPPQKMQPATAVSAVPHLPDVSHIQGTSLRPERKVMEPKTIFPHFWRRKQDGHQADEDEPTNPRAREAAVNKSSTTEPTPSGPRGELLGYEDIYRAAGILSPGSGYGIHKVVEMLNSDRLRDLAADAKRASVLMALDAAGISADDLLTDATRRRSALTSYESSQVKQLEDFEARKAKENSKIEEEMEKIRMHYAQRVQANVDHVTKEKEALRNWQMAMQHETQRIDEVIELCGKQAAPAPKASAMAAAAGTGAEKAESAAAQPGASAPVRPTLSGL